MRMLLLLVALTPGRLLAEESFFEEESTWQKRAAWISVGITAALLTTGGILAEAAEAREKDLELLTTSVDFQTGLPYAYNDQVRAQYEDAAAEGETLERLSRITLVAAGVAAGAVVSFFLLDSPSVRVEPTIGGAHTGLRLAWEF